MVDILPNSRASRQPGNSRRTDGQSGSHPWEDRVCISASPGSVYLSTAITVSQGYSVVWLPLKPDDFRAVLDKMIEADREAVLLAVAEVLVEHHAAAKEERDAAAKAAKNGRDAARQQNVAKLRCLSITRD